MSYTIDFIDENIREVKAELADLYVLRRARALDMGEFSRLWWGKWQLLQALNRWRSDWKLDTSSLWKFLSRETQPESFQTLPGAVSGSVDNSTGLEGQKSE